MQHVHKHTRTSGQRLFQTRDHQQQDNKNTLSSYFPKSEVSFPIRRIDSHDNVSISHLLKISQRNGFSWSISNLQTQTLKRKQRRKQRRKRRITRELHTWLVTAFSIWWRSTYSNTNPILHPLTSGHFLVSSQSAHYVDSSIDYMSVEVVVDVGFRNRVG